MDVMGMDVETCHGHGLGLPGFRRRTPHNAETAALTTGSAVKARPAATRVLPTLWEGRCVPFTIADESVATVRSLRLFGVNGTVRVSVRVRVRVRVRFSGYVREGCT